MEFAKNVQKNLCRDCNREIMTKDDGRIINGFELVYQSGGGKIKVLKCKDCFEKDKSLRNYQDCEVYSRVCGYLRPVGQWNLGKQKEYSEREEYKN